MKGFAGKYISRTDSSSARTNALGIAFVSVWTGDKPGPYTYTAECPSCGQEPDAQCVLSADLPPSMAAEPEDVGPVAGNPEVTPMLRISNIGYPNDGVSFTTLFGENKVDLAADLKPDTPEYNTLSAGIAWTVEDSKDDDMDSGDPDNPAAGPATYFYVTHVPEAPTGRQFPLKYKIDASVDTPKGRVKAYPRSIRQDVIDKCRQEYLDFDLTLNEVNRSRFTPGTHPEYAQNPLDCYAYIYPSRATEAEGLKTQFVIRVNSGYRSPRKNMVVRGAVESRHMFGDAVDIEVLPETPSNYHSLWQSAANPKMLEISHTIILKRDSSGELIKGNETLDLNKNGIPDVFERFTGPGWMHLGD